MELQEMQLYLGDINDEALSKMVRITLMASFFDDCVPQLVDMVVDAHKIINKLFNEGQGTQEEKDMGEWLEKVGK